MPDSNWRPLGYEPSELPTAPTCDVQPIFTDELHLIMILNITFSFAEFLQSHQNNSETFGDTIGFEPIFPYDKNGIFKLYGVLPIALSISLIYVFKVRECSRPQSSVKVSFFDSTPIWSWLDCYIRNNHSPLLSTTILLA